MIIEENQSAQSAETANDDITAAENSLESALATIKGNAPEPAKKETLRLPKKVEAEAPQEEATEENNQSDEEFDPKAFVEVESPQIQKKINYLYKQTKEREEREVLLKDELRKMADVLTQKEQNEVYLANRLAQIENRFSNEDESRTLTDLRNQYKEAINNMDYDRAGEINEKIVDFKTEQKLNAVIKANVAAESKQQQDKQKKGPEFYSNPQDVADANKFAVEKSDDGSVLRPWLSPNHPEFYDTVDLMAAISNKYIRKGQTPSLSAVMSEVDKYKGVKTEKGSSKDTSIKYAPVLSGNNTSGIPQENQEIKLSELERSFANKMGVSEKDYARYKKFTGPISVDSIARK
jgi:hypothetical protein